MTACTITQDGSGKNYRKLAPKVAF